MPSPVDEETALFIQRSGSCDNGSYGGTSSTMAESRHGATVLTASINDPHRSSTHSVKSIGYLGSLAIAVNSLAGPAVLQLPFQYQRSGLIPTTICLVFVSILSYFVSLHMANVVSQVPGNHKFKHCIEFSDPFFIFWGPRAFQITQVLFFLCTTCLNVAAIVDTAEVVDSFLGLQFESVGFNAQTLTLQTWSHGPCSRKEVKLGLCDPFGDADVYGDYLLTLGYLLTALVFVPVCLMDLKENTSWQIFGFAVLTATSIYFCATFSTYELSLKHVSLWGSSWKGMLGVILFNFALVLAIPAWLHEKKETVNVNQVIQHSTAMSTGLYICVGILGAFAIPKVNVNMLSPMVSGAFGSGIQIAGSVFAFFIIGLDIPLFSVLTRYNLTHSGMCSERTANIFVVWLPWLTSWLWYQGDAIGSLLSWGGVLLTSAVAFLLPLYLALRILQASDQKGSILVYGFAMSRDRQICILYALVAVAAAAVFAAIGGQILVTREKQQYLHSELYYNGTDLALTLLGAEIEKLLGITG
jgi:hypothetical protein